MDYKWPLYMVSVNAIVMLLMLNDSYVNGAIISATIHKSFMIKYNLKFDLVLMCDETIYNNYYELLSLYFDKVELIPLRHIVMRNDYKLSTKYSEWIEYSINKMQCIRFTDYDKILFMDVDLIAKSKEFYNIFNLNAPAFYQINLDRNNESYNSFEDYINNKKTDINQINASLFLLKPSNETYEKYVQFTNKVYEDGLYSLYYSGPDETSMYYFYRYILKSNITVIPNKYAIIPWKNSTKDSLAINYPSFIKPWKKPRILMWPEEYIWRKVLSLQLNNEQVKLLATRDYLYSFYVLAYKWKSFKQNDKPFNYTNLNSIDEDFLNKIKKDRKLYEFVNNKTIDYNNHLLINKLKQYYYIALRECLTYDEKIKFLTSINSFYQYDSSVINTMATYNICRADMNKLGIQLIPAEKKEALLNLLKIITNFLEVAKIEYWIDGGTLLGAMQTGKMIEWDDDIDLAIPSDHFTRFYKLINNKKVKSYFTNNNIKFVTEYAIKHRNKSNNIGHLKMRFINGINNDIFIDLIHFIKIHDKYYHNISLFNYPYDIKDVYPLRKVLFEGIQVSCINNPYPFLDNGYWFWRHVLAARYSHLDYLKNLVKDRNTYYINETPYVENRANYNEGNMYEYIMSELNKLPEDIRHNIIVDPQDNIEINSSLSDYSNSEYIKNMEKLFKNDCIKNGLIYDKLDDFSNEGIQYKILKKGSHIFRVDSGFLTKKMTDDMFINGDDAIWFTDETVSYSFARASYIGVSAFKIKEDIKLLDFYNTNNIKLLLSLNNKKITKSIIDITSYNKSLSDVIKLTYERYNNRDYVVFSRDKRLYLYSKPLKFIGNRNKCNVIVDDELLYCSTMLAPTRTNLIEVNELYKRQYFYYEGEIKKNMFSIISIYGCTEHQEIVLPKEIVLTKIERDTSHPLDWNSWMLNDNFIPSDGILFNNSLNIMNLSNDYWRFSNNINTDFNVVKFINDNTPQLSPLDDEEYIFIYNVSNSIKQLNGPSQYIRYIKDILYVIHNYYTKIRLLFLQGINIENNRLHIVKNIFKKMFTVVRFVTVKRQQEYSEYHIIAAKRENLDIKTEYYSFNNPSNIKEKQKIVSIIYDDNAYVSLPLSTFYKDTIRIDALADLIAKYSIKSIIGSFNFTKDSIEHNYLLENGYTTIIQPKYNTSPLGCVDKIYSKEKINMRCKVIKVNYAVNLPVLFN